MHDKFMNLRQISERFKLFLRIKNPPTKEGFLVRNCLFKVWSVECGVWSVECRSRFAPDFILISPESPPNPPVERFFIINISSALCRRAGDQLFVRTKSWQKAVQGGTAAPLKIPQQVPA